MFDYEVRYKINDMTILKILRDHSQKQSDLSILEYTDTKLFVNFRPWNETIQILNGVLILTECGNSLPPNIVDSIEQYCTEIKRDVARTDNKTNTKYIGFVEDRYYPDSSHDCERGDFDTPESAFKWAKKTAGETGFTHVSYWVEIDEDSTVDGFSGMT